MKTYQALLFLLCVSAIIFSIACEQRSETDQPTFTSFDEWAKANAVPIKTTQPGSGFEDLDIL